MIPQRTMLSLATTAFLGAALFVSQGCGGGNDSSGTTTSGPVAIFTPDVAAPGPGSVALQSGTGSGASISVRVTVTGVSGVFGAAFRIQFDPTALQFNGMTDSGSFLRDGGVTESNLIFTEDHSSTPGEIKIVASRLDPTAAPPVDVTTTADLVILSFTARKVLLPAATEGRVEFGDPKQVCDGTVVAPGCGSIAVTWSGGGISAQ